MSRSMDTDGSPASILATRDWLDLMSFANCTWLSRRRLRLCRRLSLNRTFRSIYRDSSGVSSRNSSALPTFHPFFSSLSFFALRIVITLQSFLTCIKDMFRRLLNLLAEHLRDHHGIWIRPIDDSPRDALVGDSQFVASPTNAGHRPGMRQVQFLSLLQSTKEISSLQPGRPRKRRRFHFPVQPDERFVIGAHP
jgi:hypothetical protein